MCICSVLAPVGSKLNDKLLVLLLDFFQQASSGNTEGLVLERCFWRGFVLHLELLHCVVLGEVALVKKRVESVAHDVLLCPVC
jgi:hypothetical protein